MNRNLWVDQRLPDCDKTGIWSFLKAEMESRGSYLIHNGSVGVFNLSRHFEVTTGSEFLQ